MIISSDFQEGIGGDALVIHDVPHAPCPAGPGIRMIDRRFVFDQSLLSAAKLSRLDARGSGNACRRSLQKQTGDVLPPAGVARAAEPVRGEWSSVNQTRFHS